MITSLSAFFPQRDGEFQLSGLIAEGCQKFVIEPERIDKNLIGFSQFFFRRIKIMGEIGRAHV